MTDSGDALELLRSPHFFTHLRQALTKAGLVGEQRNAIVLFVAAVSRLLPKPLNLFVKGHSSAGKNFLARTVLRFMPPSAVFELSSATAAAWHYAGKNLMHKIVYVQEMAEHTGTTHATRLLISEDKLVRMVTRFKDGKRVTERRVTKGPVACISTSTQEWLQFDDESRRVSIWIDESREQTARIARATLSGSPGLSPQELKAWHDVQRLLAARAQVPVELPSWFPGISEHFSTADIRVRRYVPAFLSALNTVCVIRSFRRPETEVLERGKLVVRFSDLAVTALIFEPAFTKSLRAVGGSDADTLEAIERILSRNRGKPVSASALSAELGNPLDKAYALLRRGEGRGTIRRANKAERNNKKYFVPAERSRFLPDPGAIFQTLDGFERVRFVHPITGEQITYTRQRGREP